MSIRSIGRILGRSHTVIAREIKRYKSSVRLKDYMPHKAQFIAEKQKSKASTRSGPLSDQLMSLNQHSQPLDTAPDKPKDAARDLPHSPWYIN